MKDILFLFTLVAFPIMAQPTLDDFADLLPKEKVQERELLSKIDKADHLFELSPLASHKNSSSCIEAIAKKQQSNFVEGHCFDDLKVENKKSLFRN